MAFVRIVPPSVAGIARRRSPSRPRSLAAQIRLAALLGTECTQATTCGAEET